MSFFPGRGAAMALSADRRGRLALHVFSAIMGLKTAVASRPVLDGSLGVIGAVSHLTPFFATTTTTSSASAASASGAAPASASAGVVASPSGGGGGGGAASGGASGGGAAAPGGDGVSQPPPPSALAPPACRVGDGLVAVTATSGCHIGRFKPSGELIPLYSIPRPAAVPAPSIPSAAWLPHQRRAARPPPTAADPSPGGATAACAVLAVGWHDEVMFVDVPLIGDHQLPAPPPPPSPSEAANAASSSAAAAAAAAAAAQQQAQQQQQQQQQQAQQGGQAKRTFLRAATALTGVARGAAAAATAAAAAAATAASAAATATSSALASSTSQLDSLTPTAASALAERLPLVVTRVWNAIATIASSGSDDGSSVLSTGGVPVAGDDVSVRVVGECRTAVVGVGWRTAVGVGWRLRGCKGTGTCCGPAGSPLVPTPHDHAPLFRCLPHPYPLFPGYYLTS